MTYTKTLSAEQDKIMEAKSITMGKTINELFDFILDNYIIACGRDVEEDLNSKLNSSLAQLNITQKQAIFEQIKTLK